ncbi:hypothetical protein L1887_57164 [Cichorium endivia]|nr:hypothetical protein L1887_57164 [Cichorium endivia]
MGNVALVSFAHGVQKLEGDPSLFDRAEEGSGADAVVQVAVKPLTDKVACTFGLDDFLVGEHVGDIGQRLALDADVFDEALEAHGRIGLDEGFHHDGTESAGAAEEVAGVMHPIRWRKTARSVAEARAVAKLDAGADHRGLLYSASLRRADRERSALRDAASGRKCGMFKSRTQMVAAEQDRSGSDQREWGRALHFASARASVCCSPSTSCTAP